LSAVTVGIDLGGTKIQAVALDGDEVRADAKVATPAAEGVEAVVAAVVDCVDQLGLDHIGSIGLGVPGAVDRKRGMVLRAPNLTGLDEPVALGALVADALEGRKVTLVNDVSAGTFAEHRLGAGRGLDDLIGVFFGTGVGGALVAGGQLYEGTRGLAGEIGHVVVRDGGRRCGCGQSGHLESYAGRGSMEAEARRRDAEGDATALVELAGDGRMKSSVWERALAQGDAVTISLLDEAVDAAGAALASVIALLDLGVVVVGGGMADRLGAGFVGRIEQATRERLFIPGSPLRVMPATLGDLAGAVGAALMARH
jgi:glucokinase